jgi:formylglycine-generating enzyme required for sulfatase activity
MLLASGIYCPYVGHRCVDWIEQNRDRCRRYDEKTLCEGLKVEKRFCIDRYEFPNQAGAYPAVMTSWVEAERACKLEGKRLCTESEWTFACEGERMLPHPYGYERDASACNIDRRYRDPDFSAFSHDRRVSAEVARLDQRVPSGSMDRCRSPFGVQDMTGNVDEWVVNEDPNEDAKEDVSSLKGGYWGPIRARCRPVTNSHNRWFRFYQVGFRCCADPPG